MGRSPDRTGYSDVFRKTGEHTLNHYAVYLANEQWLKGEFQVTLFGPSEIYINNEKKLTYTETAKATKTIPCEFVPGKQTVIVKTVSEGGKAFALSFKVKEPESAAIAFSLSPKRGKTFMTFSTANTSTVPNSLPAGNTPSSPCKIP